jgi:D-glycero-alpha-D-manno-heptose-7-phosphate kinase
MVRDAQEVLAVQDTAMRTQSAGRRAVESSLSEIKDLGYRILDAIQSENFDQWGQLLHEHWENKKRMSDRISAGWIDELYDEVRDRFGVLGGKIIGAGGGGFLMLYCEKEPLRLEDFMISRGLPRLYYAVEPEGSRVVAHFAAPQFSTHTATEPPLARIGVPG